jgi:hypothetical protein
MALAFRPIHDAFLRYSECLTTGSKSPNRGAKAFRCTEEHPIRRSFPRIPAPFGLFDPTVHNTPLLRHGDSDMAELIGASRAAGDIALQALIFALIETVANSYENPKEIREIMRTMPKNWLTGARCRICRRK